MGRAEERRHSYQTRSYIDGNTVRRVQYDQTVPRRQTQKRTRRNPQTRRARARALQMNFGYVAFLAAAGVASLFVSVNYLKLQATQATYRDQISAKESEYTELKMKNDEDYARVLSSVDLEYVRDVAINKLGMVYAAQGQVQTYDSQEGDFVRQYEDVPAE
ncbi:MAG TPA: hypothetical protein IAB44_01015 [Candidatus Limivivens intestinipullorum]|uniref:Cell division protein FtsL n=1 Tax=Candidatus Limivivens intestinipullorum TaxID=2840858 RepID=A0A9D1JJ91_9FIRM|nr:hypothetical protein [Candidatus Limivivens intestinipullorum]